MAGGIKCAKYDYKLWEIFSEFFKIVLMRPQAKMQNGRPPFFIEIHSIVCQLEVLCWLELQIVVNH